MSDLILTIEGTAYSLTPLKDFRAAHGLPPEFGIAHFEAKDYSGLGRIDRAGAELNAVRAAVLAALPERLTPQGWLAFLPDLTRLFENQLYAINDRVGLKDVEIGYAVSGFSDVCQACAYALVRANATNAPAPDFRTVYSEWLDQTARLYGETQAYNHNGENWTLQIIAHAYGRIGLLIQTSDSRLGVYDPALACPAEGFMTALLSEVAGRMGVL